MTRFPEASITRRRLLGGSSALALLSTAGFAAAKSSPPRTVEAGYLTVAMTGDMPLAGVQDGALSGMDGNVLLEIAKRLDLKIKPALMEWVSTIEAVRTGRADIMIGNVGWTKKRTEVIALTDPVYYVTRALVQRKDSQIDNVGAMSGKRVGTVQGFVSIPDLRRVPGTTEFKLYDSPDACIRDVIAGRLDAAALDAPILDNLIKKNPDWGLAQRPIRPDPDFPFLTGRNQAVWGLRQENCELFNAINQGIAWATRTGLVGRSLEQYLTAAPYLKPIENHQRIGVDRDASGKVIGGMAQCKGDYADRFA